MFTRHFSLHIILASLLCSIGMTAFSQNKPADKETIIANAKVSVNRTRILLGEQIELTLRLETLQGEQSVQWPQLPDSLNHFEVLKRTPLDSIVSGNNLTYTQTLTLTSFDSGHWVLPSVSFIAGKKSVKTDSLEIDVTNVVLKGKDYNDIKEIIEVPDPGFDWKKWLPYIIGIVLVAALVLYWLSNRKKKPVVEKPVSRSTAYDEAMVELKKLKGEQLPEKGEVKQFYSRLYDIYRIYLGRYSGTKLMQSTTDDLLVKMKDKLPSASFSRIAEVLRISDAVKFAKYPSSVSESATCWDAIAGSVEELNRQKA
jgi:BatD DUF11 like domain